MFGLGETNTKKCLQRLERLRKEPANPRKKQTQKPTNPEISLFEVVFGFFFLVPKLLTFCERGRSAEIFPEMYMFGTK